MNKLAIAAAATLMMGTPMYAASDDAAATEAPTGNVEEGEEAFNRQCSSCHVVKDASGETLAGRNARTGPNLYGIAGRTLGSEDGFRYGKPLVELGEQGKVWDEATFSAYVQDPTGWLRDALEDKKARSRMAFKVRKEEDAHDVYAFLHSLAPPEM